MTPQAVIFDLDGTLVDSAPVVGAILDGMRGERGLAPLDHALYREWSSRGGAVLVGRALDIAEEDAAAAVAEFRARYAGIAAEEAHLYAGVRETLRRLAASGCALGLCTNKPDHLTRNVLRDLDLRHVFATVVAGEPGRKAKPDREPLDRALAVLGASPDRAIFVGDSRVDQQTAAAAGVRFAFFSGGYDDGVDRAAVDHHLDAISDLLTLV